MELIKSFQFDADERKILNDVFIINERGAMLFPKASAISNQFSENLPNLMLAFQSLAVDLGKKKVDSIELGNMKIYSTRDESSKMLFLYRTKKKTKKKKARSLLNKIKTLFTERFNSNPLGTDQMQDELCSQFADVLTSLLKEKNQVSSFLKAL